MGIYDRDYYHESPGSRRGRSYGSGWSMVTKIIVANVAVFLANGLLTPDNRLSLTLAITSHTIERPWEYWQFLTYGFVHEPSGITHILFNMLGLFFLGPEVERRLGSREFLRFYLATIVFGGLVWGICNVNTPQRSLCWGASGGVVGVCVLFAMLFPHRTILFWFIPMPAWMLGVIIVGQDVFTALWGNSGFGMGNQRVAVAVHLAGAYFAFVYKSYGWNFGRGLEKFHRRFLAPIFTPRPKKPKLNLYDPDEEKQTTLTEEEKLAAQVDEVLKKYSRVGESGLTPEEKDILQKASKMYREKGK